MLTRKDKTILFRLENLVVQLHFATEYYAGKTTVTAQDIATLQDVQDLITKLDRKVERME